MEPQPAVGVDYSIAMCALAEAKGMAAYNADIMALPFAEQQFDLIYCAGIIQYIDDLPGLLAEFARVCRTGGRIVIGTVNRTSLMRRVLRVWRRISPREEMPLSYRYILRTAAEMVGAARGLPLAAVSVSWTHFPFPWLHRSRATQYALAPLASDAIVEFVKAPS
jgi:ubiquinone/menaquinone biosynthesis C-methylase UbiE